MSRREISVCAAALLAIVCASCSANQPRPGTVLVAESTRDAVANAGGFDWSPGGTRHLKGVSGDVKLFRVTRGGSPSS